MPKALDTPINYPKDYEIYKKSKVFVFRVAAHTLGRQEVNAKSENHISIYLLLGNNTSFHVDIKPIGGIGTMDTTGRLILQPRPYHTSNSVIVYTDLQARGCPKDFEPAKRFSAASSSPNVGDVVDLAISHNFHNFRYAFTDGHSVGCRMWV